LTSPQIIPSVSCVLHELTSPWLDWLTVSLLANFSVSDYMNCGT